MLPIVGIRPLSGRTGTTLLMNLLGTSPQIAFDRRYPAEYRVASYLARTAWAMTEPFDDSRHQGVTDFFFGEEPSWVPMPFASDALEVDAWRPSLLRAMWSSASEAMLAVRPDAKWYAEKLAVEEVALIDAGIPVLRVDLVRDPRDILASRRAFRAGGTEGWAREAGVVCAQLMFAPRRTRPRPIRDSIALRGPRRGLGRDGGTVWAASGCRTAAQRPSNGLNTTSPLPRSRRASAGGAVTSPMLRPMHSLQL